MTLLIADLSNNNGSLPLIVDEIAKHKNFAGVIFKITEGTHFVDTTAVAGIKRARHHGLKVGGYHFFHASQPTLAQARLFVNSAHRAGLWRKGDIRPVLDYEVEPDGHESSHRNAFYGEVHRLTGHNSILYAGGAFTTWLPAPKGSHAWWAAGYPNYVKNSSLGRPWLHQFTDSYPVGPYRIDCSRVRGIFKRRVLNRNCCAVGG